MNPKSIRTLLWLSVILFGLSVLGMAPSASLLTAFLAGLAAIVAILFGTARLRLVGVLLLLFSLAAMYTHYAHFNQHMSRYRQHVEAQ